MIAIDFVKGREVMAALAGLFDDLFFRSILHLARKRSGEVVDEDRGVALFQTCAVGNHGANDVAPVVLRVIALELRDFGQAVAFGAG